MPTDSSQDRFRTVFENSPLGQKIIDSDLVIRQANPAAVTMLGLTHHQELVGRRISEFAHPDYRADWHHLQKRLRGHKMPHFSLEICLVRADGSPLWCQVNFVLLPDEGGELSYTILEDITARKQLADTTKRLDALTVEVTAHVQARQRLEEQAYQTSQLNQELEARVRERTQALRQAQAEATAQKTQRVTESQPSTSFILDQSGQALYVSPQWYAYAGLEPNADIAATWPRLIHPDDLPAIAQELGAALAGGRAWDYEFRMRRADGQYRWFANRGVPEPLADAEAAGRPRQWFGSNLDIDELKQAQRQLEEKDQLLTNTLASLPAAVVTFEGEDLRLSFFNEAYQRLVLGQAVLGRPAVEVFPDAETLGFLPLLREVLRTGEPYQAREVWAHARAPHTGELWERYLDLAYLPLRHGQQPPYAVLCFTVDVTERVRARQQLTAANAALTAANAQLTRTNADLDNFVYTASHDLKAPISNIEGLLRLLENRLPPALRTHEGLLPVLAHLHQAVQRFTRTLGYLTEVSKLQQEFARPAALTPLAPLLEDVRQDLLPLLAETGGQLHVDDLECSTLLLSEKNLRSILYNLVSNALKYHQPGRPPVVRVSCRLEGPHRVLRVQDNGVGLDEQQQAKLFGLFQRLHTHVEGTGVGLYMVKKMVENAGGTLTVRSHPGEGSTFTAHFPA